MKQLIYASFFFIMTSSATYAQLSGDSPRVKIRNGMLEGVSASGVNIFLGVPFAAPPVGDLRWKAPQPAQNWDEIRKADKFGPRAMQPPIFGDMNFRSNGMSEDCLYLNVWTPAKTGAENLPVLVYFYGGGFVAGDGSEPRYDGESMARQGIVSVTVNYRLGAFASFAHPQLTKESPYHSSGNYGLLDQAAALQWVARNIAAFGGDPKKITIAGESAGSISVSAQMASPLSKNIIAGAIGESGSILGALSAVTKEAAEQTGIDFEKTLNVASLSELRSVPAEKLLEASTKFGPFRFAMNVDGYFFPKSPYEIYESGEQAHVPLLVGWNSQEMGYQMIMGPGEITPEKFTAAVQKLYGADAPEALKVYGIADGEDVEQVATDVAGDRFIGFSTWKWSDLHIKKGMKPVYRYKYMRPRPRMRAEMGNATAGLAGGVVRDSGSKAPTPPPAKGAEHSAEIEYALGNLHSNRMYDWLPEDYKVSEIMQTFFANFIKTGNPNGLGVPTWPAADKGEAVQVMFIDVNSKAVKDAEYKRFHFMDKIMKK